MRYIAAIPATGLIAGAATGLLLPSLPAIPTLAILPCCAALSLWAWSGGHARVLAIGVAAGFFAGGALLAADAWQRAWRPPLRIAFEEVAREQRARAVAEGRRMPEDDEAFAVVEGILRADASQSASGVSLSLAVDRLDRLDGQEERERHEGREEQGQRALVRRPGPFGPGVSGGIVVTVVGSLAADRFDQWRAGRRVRLPLTLHRPSRYLDPGVPDQERALARRGTTLVGTVKSAALVEVIARAGWFTEAISAVRAFARRAIAGRVGGWSTQSGAIVAAIVIGDRAGLDNDVQRRLQEAGTYHVIAISGGNIAILAGLLLGAFRIAGWLGRTAMVSSIAALLAYAALVGNGASVDRATLMAVVYFGARAADQRSPPLNALALVAAILVATDPLSVADPAFLLTFGATLAILVVVPAVTPEKTGENAEIGEKTPYSAIFARSAVFSFLWPMFAASVAAEALLFPIGALTFSRVTFAGLGLNFLAIPLMGIAQIAGMAVLPLTLVSETAAALAGWIAHLGAAGLVRSADLIQFAPFLTYRVAPPSWVAVSSYYTAAIICWLCGPSALIPWPSVGRVLLDRPSALPPRGRCPRRVVASVAGVIAGCAAIWILADPRTFVPRGDGRLHVTFLDVGQGDSAFVVFPGGSTLLVDAGGLASAASFDIGDRVVAPVIRDAGFRRIDFLALTHGDPDHIGGAGSILREFRPREVWEGIPVPRFAALTVLRVATEAAAARWANVYRDDRVNVDGVDVLARHPPPADWERQKVRNDDSMVLELRWREVSVLLTGDIGKAVEPGIANAVPPARLRVIKIPHHGSLTSSSTAFVEALHPRIAVASAGRANHFGHPVPEVMERYRAIGAETFRTDQDGAVTVTTDGDTIDVQTFTGRKFAVQ
jgi:competence protein ComEC